MHRAKCGAGGAIKAAISLDRIALCEEPVLAVAAGPRINKRSHHRTYGRWHVWTAANQIPGFKINPLFRILTRRNKLRDRKKVRTD